MYVLLKKIENSLHVAWPVEVHFLVLLFGFLSHKFSKLGLDDTM